jgi:hypothetical protein
MDSIFIRLSSVVDLSYKGYRDLIVEDFGTGSNPYLQKAALDLKAAMNNSEFNWKAYLRKQDFFQFAESKTEEELILDVKLMLWDVLFPDDVFQETLQNVLMEKTKVLLKRLGAIDSDSAVECRVVLTALAEEESILRNKLSLYELLRMRKYKGLWSIGMIRNNGTDLWYFYLLPKEIPWENRSDNDYWENI